MNRRNYSNDPVVMGLIAAGIALAVITILNGTIPGGLFGTMPQKPPTQQTTK